MAARTRKLSVDDRTKIKIRTTQLVKRLEGHVLGTVEMVPSQVTAALGLLKKSMPDLAAHQHTGNDGGPLKIEVVRFSDENTG